MKVVFNFIIAVIMIEIGFFLFFGSNLNINNLSENLNSYKDDNIPPVGTNVNLYVIDAGEAFLKNESYSSIMYDMENYYLVQINDGRFVTLKTSEGSEMDKELAEYARKCKEHYFLHKSDKPEYLYIEGKITKEPEIDYDSFKSIRDRDGGDKLKRERGYIRIYLSDIVVDADINISGKNTNSIMIRSLDIIATASNVLKKILGVFITVLGIMLIISFIKDILNGITYGNQEKKVIVADDNVFNNISSMKTNWHEDDEKKNREETYDEIMDKIKDKKNHKETVDRKSFSIKKDG